MLTRRTVETLTWIAGFIRREGYAPSRGEIATALGGSNANAGQLVRRLIADGYLSDAGVGHGGARARALKLTRAGTAHLRTLAENRAAAGEVA